MNFSELNLVHLYPTVILEQLFIFIGLIGFRILTEEENVKYIRSTFSKFVSKDIVDELLKNPDNLNLGGSKRDITIFSPISEDLRQCRKKWDRKNWFNF